MRALLAAATLGVAVACTPVSDAGAERVTLTDGSDALRWGDGEYGVVLVAGEGEEAGDWGPLAQEIAANRMTAVAVDPAGLTADRLRAAAAWLTTTGIERVAVVASGIGGGRVAVDHARSGGVIDQLILVSGSMTDAELADLGEPPKLFVAAEADAASAEAANHMTEVAAGTWNVLLLVPGAERGLAIFDGEGAGDLIDGVVARLEERR